MIAQLRWTSLVLIVHFWATQSRADTPTATHPEIEQRWKTVQAAHEEFVSHAAFACQFEVRHFRYPNLDAARSENGGKEFPSSQGSGFLAKFGRHLRLDFTYVKPTTVTNIQKQDGVVIGASFDKVPWSAIANDRIELDYTPRVACKDMEGRDVDVEFGGDVHVRSHSPNLSGYLAPGLRRCESPIAPISFSFNSLHQKTLTPVGPMNATEIKSIDFGKGRAGFMITFQNDVYHVTTTAVFDLKPVPPHLTEMHTLISGREGNQTGIDSYFDSFEKCMGGRVAARVRTLHWYMSSAKKRSSEVNAVEWKAKPGSWRKPKRGDFVLDVPRDVRVIGLNKPPEPEGERLILDVNALDGLQPVTEILRHNEAFK